MDNFLINIHLGSKIPFFLAFIVKSQIVNNTKRNIFLNVHEMGCQATKNQLINKTKQQHQGSSE